MYTGSITQGISLTNVMAPVIWYKTFTSRICSHGIGIFSNSFMTACGIYFNALQFIYKLKITKLKFENPITTLYNLPQIDTLVVSVFSTAHVTMISDNLSYMLGWHIFFLGIHKTKLSFLRKSL